MCAIVKYCLCICLLFCAGYKGNAHIIDSLKTEEEVRFFLEGKIDSYRIIYLNECVGISRAHKIRADSAGMDTIVAVDPVTDSERVSIFKSYWDAYEYADSSTYWSYCYECIKDIIKDNQIRFSKADLDGNGHYDLIVDAGIVMVVLDKVTLFECHVFADLSVKYSFEQIIPLPHKSVGLTLRCEKQKCNDSTSTFQYTTTDTVVYMHNGFINYNSHSSPAGISKINYTQSIRASGTDCIEINKDGSCYLRYIDLAHFKKLHARMDKAELDKLWQFLSYIDIKSKIDGYYELTTAHLPINTFSLHFDDDTVKQIEIFYCCPDIDMACLSRYMYDLSRQLKWEAVEEQPADFECPCRMKEKAESNAEQCDCSFGN